MWIIITMIFMTLTSVISEQNGSTSFSSNLLNVKISENEKNVIRKCCGLNSYREFKNHTCINTTEEFDPPIYEEENNNETIKEGNIFINFNVTVQYVNCRSSSPTLLNNIKLFKNGNILGQNEIKEYEKHSLNNYCIDNIVGYNTSEPELSAVVCGSDTLETGNNPRKLNSIFMLISCFFIVLTIAVYACLPITLHAMVLIAYLSSFLVGFIFLATMNIVGLFTKQCVVFTFIIYFSLLSAFFWLNVMCFDIWYTFSGKRSLSGPSSMRSQFISYSIYAFGVPAILTILLAILEFTIDQRRSFYLPRLFIQKCFISGYSKAVYLYGPMVILCVANLTFFVLTAREISLTKRTIEQGLHRADKKRFTLYIKLFIVTGVNWILEVVSSYFPNAVAIWRFTDAYNLLVGLIIFIVFVCKRKTFNSLMNRMKSQPRPSTDQRNYIRKRKFNRYQNSNETKSSFDTIRTPVTVGSKSERSD